MKPTMSPGDGIGSQPCPSLTSAGKADPWILRKFMVIIVLCLSVWALYVGVGRVCIPAIHRWDSAAYSRPAGVAILVTYLILWLLFMWSYIAIITTSAGCACDHVPATPEPRTFFVGHQTGNHGEEYGAVPGSTTPQTAQPSSAAGGELPPATTAFVVPFDHSANLIRPANAPVQRPRPHVSAEPRWCRYCKIIKPDRTHHCRHCGYCVMQFDHHCVWIGRCVGWANHAIFITFNFWTGLFCLFNTVILAINVTRSNAIDGQMVALIAISGLMCVITLFLMLPTHIMLVIGGKTTLESFESGTQQRAEAAALKSEFPALCPVRDIRRVRRQWDEEFGGVQCNDRWAFGRRRDMWRQEMGDRFYGWIFPVGRPLGDGLHFPANPRFGPHGEWLRMEEWPKVVTLPS